ncbi:hypothetical protein DVK00_03220 [Haloarcula sp. Atlit-47R]|jgi:hypothetical protein|uniref:hypothetical protein n=1 Tax=Haloarcula sp. Atlit-47R TaxID=2282132 RepID=UPI000EF19FD4|nr:hypothetical protein [Haloarcula sp. Atlit-47R]RLM47533.1 hypothetical protein DVK00_03220 [Haloarcula sp. Atlit-47R]
MSDYSNIDSTESKVRAAAAELNELAEKERMAEKIVANSAEYEDTDAVIEDFPTKKSLGTKLDILTKGAAMPATGATANVTTDGQDPDVGSGILTDLSVNDDDKDTEDSDAEFDVGSGVLD